MNPGCALVSIHRGGGFQLPSVRTFRVGIGRIVNSTIDWISATGKLLLGPGTHVEIGSHLKVTNVSSFVVGLFDASEDSGGLWPGREISRSTVLSLHALHGRTTVHLLGPSGAYVGGVSISCTMQTLPLSSSPAPRASVAWPTSGAVSGEYRHNGHNGHNGHGTGRKSVTFDLTDSRDQTFTSPHNAVSRYDMFPTDAQASQETPVAPESSQSGFPPPARLAQHSEFAVPYVATTRSRTYNDFKQAQLFSHYTDRDDAVALPTGAGAPSIQWDDASTPMSAVSPNVGPPGASAPVSTSTSPRPASSPSRSPPLPSPRIDDVAGPFLRKHGHTSSRVSTGAMFREDFPGGSAADNSSPSPGRIISPFLLRQHGPSREYASGTALGLGSHATLQPSISRQEVSCTEDVPQTIRQVSLYQGDLFSPQVDAQSPTPLTFSPPSSYRTMSPVLHGASPSPAPSSTRSPPSTTRSPSFGTPLVTVPDFAVVQQQTPETPSPSVTPISPEEKSLHSPISPPIAPPSSPQDGASPRCGVAEDGKSLLCLGCSRVVGYLTPPNSAQPVRTYGDAETPQDGARVSILVSLLQHLQAIRPGTASSQTFEPEVLVHAHSGAVQGVALSPSGGMLWSVGDDGNVLRWNMATLETGSLELSVDYTYTLDTASRVMCVTATEQGNVCVGDCNGSVAVFSSPLTESLLLEQPIALHDGQHAHHTVHSVVYVFDDPCICSASHGSGEFVMVGSAGGDVAILALTRREPNETVEPAHREVFAPHVVIRLECLHAAVYSMSCAGLDRFLCGTSSGELHCWSLQLSATDVAVTKTSSRALHSSTISAICVCKYNSVVVTAGCDGVVRFSRLTGGQVVAEFRCADGCIPIAMLHLPLDDQILLATSARDILVLRAPSAFDFETSVTRNVVHSVSLWSAPTSVFCLALSKDQLSVIVGLDNGIVAALSVDEEVKSSLRASDCAEAQVLSGAILHDLIVSAASNLVSIIPQFPPDLAADFGIRMVHRSAEQCAAAAFFRFIDWSGSSLDKTVPFDTLPRFVLRGLMNGVRCSDAALLNEDIANFVQSMRELSQYGASKNRSYHQFRVRSPECWCDACRCCYCDGYVLVGGFICDCSAVAHASCVAHCVSVPCSQSYPQRSPLFLALQRRNEKDLSTCLSEDALEELPFLRQQCLDIETSSDPSQLTHFLQRGLRNWTQGDDSNTLLVAAYFSACVSRSVAERVAVICSILSPPSFCGPNGFLFVHDALDFIVSLATSASYYLCFITTQLFSLSSCHASADVHVATRTAMALRKLVAAACRPASLLPFVSHHSILRTAYAGAASLDILFELLVPLKVDM